MQSDRPHGRLLGLRFETRGDATRLGLLWALAVTLCAGATLVVQTPHLWWLLLVLIPTWLGVCVGLAWAAWPLTSGRGNTDGGGP